MNTGKLQWAIKAQRRQFEQLESAQKQAEGWRTGLAGLTTVLGGVLILKGRDNVSDLVSPYNWVVVICLGVAFVGLVGTTLFLVRAASGGPSEQLLLTGEDLRAWSRVEVRKIQHSITWSARITVVSLGLLGAAIGFAWLAPPVADDGGSVAVVGDGTVQACGTLAGVRGDALLLQSGGPNGPYTTIPLASITSIAMRKDCGR